jgi:hypothetical protein
VQPHVLTQDSHLQVKKRFVMGVRKNRQISLNSSEVKFSTPRWHGVTWFDLLRTAATTRPSLSLSDLDSSLVLSCACSISDVTVDVGRE